ncbi:MAG: hypothetical protein ACFCUQ_13965 [Kiloniellales bacterium]
MATTRLPKAENGELPSAQQELAESLLRCMGRDSAIHVCKMNGWAGVLDVLMDGAGAAAIKPSRKS